MNYFEFLSGPLQSVDVKYLAEFAGTMLLLLFGNGVCANVSLSKTKGNGTGFLMVCVGWTLAVGVGVYLFSRTSGAHFNPAITVTLALAGQFPWSDVLPYVVAQFAGAFVGAVLTFLVYRKQFQATDDANAKLGLFCTMPEVRSPFWNLVTEALATAALLFVVTGLGYASRDPEGAAAFDPGFCSLVVGLLILAIGLSLGGPTGFAINPARDFGPRLAHALLPIAGKRSSDWGYAWVPIVGPMIGALIGYGAWYLLFAAEALPSM